MFPELSQADKGKGFVMVMVNVLPSGLIGLLIAAFFAAYMSTIASQTVWGTSYIINDLFRPFIKPNASEKYYVAVSRATTFLLMILSLIVTSKLETISGAWKFVLACSGGIGPVLLFRWFWWRINAWSEISAMLAPYIIYPYLLHRGVSYEASLMLIVGW
jgi:Na+/proline symporter